MTPRWNFVSFVLAVIVAGSSAPAADEDNPARLILAEAAKRPGEPPTEAEKNLLECVARGDWYRPEPARSVTIRADWIAWVCTAPKVAPLVTHRGVLIEGVRVAGWLNLVDARIGFPLAIKSSLIPAKIDLVAAEVRSLNLDGSKIGGFNGRSMKAAFDIRLGHGFAASETVDLSNAEIGGDLNLSGGRFHNPGGVALYADYMRIGRDLLMSVNFDPSNQVSDRFEAWGIVRLTSSTIEGAVNCDGGRIANPGLVAVDAAGMTVRSNLHLSRKQGDKAFEVHGLVELSNARVGGNLYCGGGVFADPDVVTGQAIRGHGLDVGGDIELSGGFRAQGRVDLTGARVGGLLDCEAGSFSKPVPQQVRDPVRDAIALDVGSAAIGHDVRLGQGFRADGVVNLERTTIGGNLEGGGGVFDHPAAMAIDASGMAIKGDVRLGRPRQAAPDLQPFRATGSVRLASAQIGGNLDCAGGTFQLVGHRPPRAPAALNLGPEPCVLDASGAAIEGDAHLDDGFEPLGKVKLFNAKVGRHLFIGGLSDRVRNEMVLDLRAAQAGGFNHPLTGRPTAQNLIIDGFAYDSVSADQMDADGWIGWLRRQRTYAGGPHERLAAVLLKSGHAEVAKQILLDKEVWKGESLASESPPNLAAYVGWPIRWLWFRVIGPIIGYGYGPEYSFGYALALVLLGWLVFASANRRGVFAPKDPNQVPPRPFVPWLYSIDLFTPVISFYEREGWVLDLRPGVGKPRWALRTFRLYWMSHIVLGWIITSLLVAGFLGLVHHE